MNANNRSHFDHDAHVFEYSLRLLTNAYSSEAASEVELEDYDAAGDDFGDQEDGPSYLFNGVFY